MGVTVQPFYDRIPFCGLPTYNSGRSSPKRDCCGPKRDETGKCQTCFGLSESLSFRTWTKTFDIISKVFRLPKPERFRNAVPLWGRTTQTPSNLSPKRDCCGPKRVINHLAPQSRFMGKLPITWAVCPQKRVDYSKRVKRRVRIPLQNRPHILVDKLLGFSEGLHFQ